MATWQALSFAYIAIGVLIILTPRARKEVLGGVTPEEIKRNPLWQIIVFYCVTIPIAVLFWPFFLPSWFRNRESIWDQLNLPSNRGGSGLKELYDVMNSLSEGGCDSDEIPGATGEFGWEPSNPVPAHTTFGSTSYLAKLRTSDGDKLHYERIGSFASPVSEMPVDGYELTDASGNDLGIIYISPYHRRNSEASPNGLYLMQILSNEQ